MKILVATSSVPDTTSKINFTADKKSFDKSGVQFVINPYDEFSLTRAIWFQEKQNATVTVVTVGDASTESVIRKALAIGANDAVRINAEPTDSLAVAQEIASVAKEGNYDLLLFGKESIDYNGGIVPSLVAGLLDFPIVNACIGLEIDNGKATAVREIDGGKETVSCALPAIIAGQKGLVAESDLRIPNMRGIMTARTKPITVKEPSAKISQTETVGFEAPTPRSSVKLIDKDNVAELVKLLHEEAKVI